MFRRIPQHVAVLIFASVFAIFVVKIVLRYALAINLAWADEICTVLFVWLIFWSNAFLIPDHKQIAFDLVVRGFPPRAQRAAIVVRNLVIGGLFLAALPGAVGYILFLWRERTPVLQLRLDFVYACFGLFLVSVCVRAARNILRA